MADRIRVTISRTIAADLQVRCPDPQGAWEDIDKAGVYYISADQARRIVGDCDYQGNITGDYIDPVSGGLTRAYRALYAQLTKALEAQGEHAS